MGDWKHLLELLPALRKSKLITAEQLEVFEKNIYCELFKAERTKEVENLKRLWNDVPKYIRKNPDVVYAYVKKLLASNTILIAGSDLSKEIEDLIRKTLKYQYHAGLVRIYGNLPFVDLNRQLVIVGAWLKMYGQEQMLLLTLAKLCVRIQLWGKARDYFEKCLAIGPCPEATLEYGKLLEQLGEATEAMHKYRKGLTQLVISQQE